MAEQMFSSSQGYMIGGPGLTVEVDESMFGNSFFAKFFIFLLLLGKRKYRRGRISGRRQMWVLGGVVGICFTILQINLMIKIRMINIFTVKNPTFSRYQADAIYRSILMEPKNVLNSRII